MQVVNLLLIIIFMLCVSISTAPICGSPKGDTHTHADSVPFNSTGTCLETMFSLNSFDNTSFKLSTD